MADPALTLHYAFDEQKVLTAKEGLGPDLTFTRASANATYFDSSGVLQTAGTDVARFDHDPGDGNTSLGLLRERTATNLGFGSEDASDNSGEFRVTISTDTDEAPDDNTTADSILETADTNTHHPNFDNITVSGSTVYTLTYFFKKLGRSRVTLNSTEAGGGAHVVWATYDLDLGTLITSSNTDRDFIIDVGGGWFRCGYSLTTDAGSTTLRPIIYTIESTGTGITNNYTGDVTKGVLVWGKQFETGAKPTSYIKTVAASETRAADVCITTTLSWLDTAATAVGTWYVRASFPFADGAVHALLTLDDDGPTDRFYFERDAAENINFATTHNADTDGLVSGTNVIAAAIEFQIGASYADDDIVLAVDNTLEIADTSAAIPLGDNPSTLRIGADSAGNEWDGHIAEIRYYNEQKSDAFVQQLSNGEITESFGGGRTLLSIGLSIGL